jgi:hypothetical protein
MRIDQFSDLAKQRLAEKKRVREVLFKAGFYRLKIIEHTCSQLSLNI